jgi:hypothetical protein
VSRRAHIQAILARISQPQREVGLLPAPTAPELELCSSPSTSSPQNRFFAWQGAEDDGERTAWFSHSLLLQPERWEARANNSNAVRLHRHPESHRVLQTDVSVKSHLSRIFPAHPRSLASVLVPRPAARRCSASHCVRPVGLGFHTKISRATYARLRPKVRARFFFGASAESTSRPWERGTSRRFAQECPEGNPGKYKQGETPWHSTKTKSL